MTKLEKALKNIEEVKRLLVDLSCPLEFGMEAHCSEDPNCEECWNQEVEE
jgi:hypothetical protein